MPAPPLAKIDVPCVAAVCFTQSQMQRFFRFGNSHKMDMVGHQAIGPYGKSGFGAPLREQIEVGLVIGVGKKHRLTPDLAEALVLWRGLKNHEARRRHLQYIGRLMREADNLEELLSALESLKAEASRDAGRFVHLEDLRDALLDPAEAARVSALERALAELPALEQSRLLHLVEAALAEREKNARPGMPANCSATCGTGGVKDTRRRGSPFQNFKAKAGGGKTSPLVKPRATDRKPS